MFMFKCMCTSTLPVTFTHTLGVRTFDVLLDDLFPAPATQPAAKEALNFFDFLQLNGVDDGRVGSRMRKDAAVAAAAGEAGRRRRGRAEIRATRLVSRAEAASYAAVQARPYRLPFPLRRAQLKRIDGINRRLRVQDADVFVRIR